MKKYILVLILITLYYSAVNADVDWSSAYFPFDTAALSTGGTFTETVLSQRLSPALATDHSFAVSTAFFDDIHIYYIAGAWKRITFDSYYYRWGSEEWRDGEGALLGEFYSADYSFAAGYSHAFGAIIPALQLRLLYKEIGAVRKNALQVSPSIIYKEKNITGGISLLDPVHTVWSAFGSWDVGYARLSLRTDYAEEFLAYFGGTFYLTSQRNAQLSLGVYDGQFSSGFSLTRGAVGFSYAVLFHTAGLTTHSFGITFSPTR